MTIRSIAENLWIKRWAGSYTFISCAYWGHQYYSVLQRVLKVHFDHTLFIHKKGVVSFYVKQDEFEQLGKKLAQRVIKNPKLAKAWLRELKKNSDSIATVMRRLEKKIPSWKEYQEFLKFFEKHLPYHVFMKKTVDFLPLEILNKFLPYFKDARIYSEYVYSDTEKYFRGVMRVISRKENVYSNYLTCLTQQEFEKYLRKKVLPNRAILKQRFEASILFFKNNRINILVGKNNVNSLEKAILAYRIKGSVKQVRGIRGYPGYSSGVARIVLDPFKVGVFNRGDILVTGMTRPEFLPIIKKSSAIITDAGGILCHAAITARELKIPCVVGTEIATKIIKNGYRLTVDATTASIKITN